ncbi:MAG: alkaline phosphatase family protein [Firmicutes bacterium]|nr:alkaline phosphatase family protein [Bacillota bacterium]
MNRLLIISFDAVGSAEWDRLGAYPNMASFAKSAALTLDARTVFLSNTYPIHCSVITGQPPSAHGLISNTEAFPEKNPPWFTRASDIRAKTLWQAVAAAGGSVAAVLWPVTGGSKDIRWNIPESPGRYGPSLITENLKSGSAGLQLRLLLRHWRLLKSLDQPGLDSFVTACASDILRKYRPNLTLVHLTCYDTLCHRYGRGAPELQTAFASLDKNLGLLLDAAGQSASVLIFSDHAQFSVHTVVAVNAVLQNMGLLRRAGDTWVAGESHCFIECCGGSAFFHPGSLDENGIARVRGVVAASEGFHRFLTAEEMRECGRENLPFGFCAKIGYCYDAVGKVEKGNHGYPPNYPGYGVFYAVRGERHEPGSVRRGGSLLDIAALAAKELGIEF